MAKPTRLRYTGKTTKVTDEDGNVIRVDADRSYAWAPARDLEEVDLAEFNAAQIKELTGGDDPLYVDDSPEAEAKPEAKPEAKAADKPAGKDSR